MELLIDGRAHNSHFLKDVESLKQWLLRAAEEAKMTVFGEPQVYHTSFPLRPPLKDSGLSGIVFLGESNITVHTYPEFKWVSINLYTCKDIDPPEELLVFIKKSMVLSFYQAFCFQRGVDLDTGEPQETKLLWSITEGS
jgi:S-adenosylmethionine/arginine decarboxylase-like enzyme